MLLAKVALGCAGTLVLAGAYTFREGIMSVQEECPREQRHVHVWLPAAVVPMALHVVPAHYTAHAAMQAGPFLPMIRALAKALEKYPNAELVDVRDTQQHVRVRTHNGKLLIDVDSPEENVHVACPLATIEDVSTELNALEPAA
jgi:hypothetical protein